jgi:hypothetical protein
MISGLCSLAVYGFVVGSVNISSRLSSNLELIHCLITKQQQPETDPSHLIFYTDPWYLSCITREFCSVCVFKFL